MNEQERLIDVACQELAELLKKKNKDYGNSAAQQFEEYGLVSFLIRMDDKMRRLKNLNKKNDPEVNESIEDTLIDQAGYSILALIEKRKQTQKKDNKGEEQ